MSKRHLVSAIAFVFLKRWPTDNPIPSSSSSSSLSLSCPQSQRKKETSDLRWCSPAPSEEKKMGFVVVISVPLILLVAILALACYLLGRRKGRTEATPMYYGPPAPPMAAGPPPK
ncbi:unnamed protein product [Musa hybrid cultivar]